MCVCAPPAAPQSGPLHRRSFLQAKVNKPLHGGLCPSACGANSRGSVGFAIAINSFRVGEGKYRERSRKKRGAASPLF